MPSQIMILSEIQSDIEAIEVNNDLYKETNFDNRANAIDFIDFHIIDRIETLPPNPKLDILKQRAGKVKRELEEIDTNLFKLLRDNIRADVYTASPFTKTIHQYLDYDFNQPDKIGYDNLDVFINGLLCDQLIPESTMERMPEMVFYQQTPARIIFLMAELAQLTTDDVFFDLGSGLGQVAILMNLISGVTTIGVEYEPIYCNYAKACALQLNLPHVQFINTDARKGDYSQGTVFFMYTPFEGSMMQQMLEILQQESLKRPIRIFTYGPCSTHVAWQSWLRCVNGNADDAYTLCEFTSLVNAKNIH